MYSCILAPKGPSLKLLASPPSRKKSLPKPKTSGDVPILQGLNNEAVLTRSPETKDNRPLYDEPDDTRADVVRVNNSRRLLSLTVPPIQYSLSSSEDGQATWDLNGVSMLSVSDLSHHTAYSLTYPCNVRL